MCKISFINCSADKVFADLIGNNSSKHKPMISPELAKWIESNEISSKNLRSNVNESIVEFSEYL